MQNTYIISFVAIATCLRGGLSDEDVPIRDDRLITTFQVVRFPNDACIGSNSRNGTCFTSAECSNKAGTAQGSCADGFGVCCTFVIATCGMTSSENITYWSQTPTDISTTVPSDCELKICPLNSNIRQLRIDFKTFVITGPSTTTVLEGHMQYGHVPKYDKGITANTARNWKTNCLVDLFSVNGVSSANNPPEICGTNSGLHMYVDADPTCNHLTFTWSPAAGPTGALKAIDSRGITSLATRSWDMTVYQYEDGHINQAPPGCTTYQWGAVKNTVTTYNQQGATTGYHLANQNQKMCIRRERGYCYACFAGAAVISFQIGGEGTITNAFANPNQVGGYACESSNGLGGTGISCGTYDSAIIPGAFAVATAAGVVIAAPTAANVRSLAVTTYNTPVGPPLSGNGVFGVGVADLNTPCDTALGTVTPHTICTIHNPFMVHFKSDGFEGTGNAADYLNVNGSGIDLNYELISCT